MNTELLGLIHSLQNQITNLTEEIKRLQGNSILKNKAQFRFGTYIKIWLEGYERNLRLGQTAPESFKVIERCIRVYYIPFFKNKDLRLIDSKDIQRFYQNLPARHSPATHRTILKYLKKLFNDALRAGHIEKAPVFPKIKVPVKEVAWLTPDKIKAILNKLPNRHFPIYYWLAQTATRPGEARALQWSSVDLANKTAVIERTFSGTSLKHSTKTGKDRTIPLSESLCQVLAELKKTRSEGFVFLTSRKLYYSRKTLTDTWAAAIKAAGLPHVKLYTLRHSFISNKLNQGISRDLLFEYAGTSMDTYCHYSLEGLKLCLQEPSMV